MYNSIYIKTHTHPLINLQILFSFKGKKAACLNIFTIDFAPSKYDILWHGNWLLFNTLTLPQGHMHFVSGMFNDFCPPNIR